MNKLPAKSVDLILTSPPFLALRSYLPADHPDKEKEGGNQATPGEFIDWLIDFAEACDRVLAPHGSLCVELGDTYSGSGGGGGDYYEGGLREGQPGFTGSEAASREALKDANAAHWRQKNQNANAWPLAKSLSLIPEMFRFSLVYGFNPLTGRTTERWRLRNVVRWVRPNPPVGALGDKFRPATSELAVFCKSAKRYFDLDAVREAPKSGPPGEVFSTNRQTIGYRGSQSGGSETAATGRDQGYRDQPHLVSNPAGAPPLDWWNVPEGEQPPPTTGGKYRWVKEERPDIQTDLGPSRGESEFPTHPGGAPPLDWWNIPPEEIRTLRYVECGCTESCLLEGPPDRFTPATSELLVFCKSAKRYFDLDAVREPYAAITLEKKGGSQRGELGALNGPKGTTIRSMERGILTHGGAPPLDWWNIPPGGYEGSHYAVFPPELCVKPIKAMCPEKVCNVCGEPSRREVEKSERYEEARATLSVRAGTGWDKASGNRADGLPSNAMRAKLSDGSEFTAAEYNTTGWTDCGHDDWRPGLVLDPFGGSGTTALVATGHGRDCILIDLDPRNYDLALERVGPFILTLGRL